MTIKIVKQRIVTVADYAGNLQARELLTDSIRDLSFLRL